MIEINLLPEELKVKSKAAKSAVKLEAKYFLYLIPIGVVILLLVHFSLAVVSISKNSQLRALDKKWQGLQPQRRELDEFKREHALLSQDAQEVKGLMGQRTEWAQKLNKLSLYLPSGIWFNEISVSPRDFVLKASVVSLERQEMNLINNFIDSLKKDESFFGNFNNLELSSVKRKAIGGYEIADFILAGTFRLNER